MIRQTCLLLHRYIGLGLAVFLIVVGITGSLLAFLPELNRLTAPALYPREKDTPALGAGELAERVQSTLVHSRVTGVNFYQAGTVEVWTTPLTEAATGKPHIEAFDQVFVDPYTGNELGRRFYGQLSQGWVNLMPFIYQLH